MNRLLVCITLFQLSFISCESKCNELAACGPCIGYSQERCVWCAQDGKMNSSRCQPESYQQTEESWCATKYIRNPQPELIITQNLEWRANDPTVQFKPQNMKIKVRPGVPVQFSVAYKPAENYPLDIYFLMDNSYSMRPIVNLLRMQIHQIYEQLRNLTNNVWFGIGTFVDKPGFPYTNPNQFSYSFKHHLSLTADMKIFLEAFSDMNRRASNLDLPEAGLDGLMQAMVCKSEVGWRVDATKVIVLLTDSTYHSSGDGKMLGIITPNDMKCHLNSEKYYSKALELDYPSVSQINKVAHDGNFSIIFATVRNVHEVYEQLAKAILGASHAELDRQTSIMDIILKSYRESVSLKKIKFDVPSNIEIHMDQECSTQTKRNCESTFDHPIINVTVTLTVKSCPIPTVKDGYHQQVILSPTNLNEALTIDVEVDCQCECEKDQGIVPEYVRECSSAGYLQCGICKCNDTRYGEDCSKCDTNMNACKQHAYEAKVCYGRGDCRCGKCVNCVASSGDYCQFDDKTCPLASNLLCAGHGICNSGVCLCHKGWRGVDCACSDKSSNCSPVHSNEEA